jgi:hypothetical protein
MYDAEQLSSIFDGIISDGMYSGFKQAMVVIESQNDNEVIIQPGRAWLLHTWAYNDANLPFEAPQSEVVLDRIDALVLDVDSNPEVKNTTFQWVQGTPASQNPERPTLIDTENHRQYPLCYVYRAAGTDTITQANITNTVGTSELPFVTGIIDTLDISELLRQWQASWDEFIGSYEHEVETWTDEQKASFTAWMTAEKAQWDAWFDNLQYVLDGDVAGHLQNEIDELTETEFEHYHGLVSGTTKIETVNGVTNIDLTSSWGTSHTEIETVAGVTTITETITPTSGTWKYVKTTTIQTVNGVTTITDSYTKEAKANE